MKIFVRVPFPRCKYGKAFSWVLVSAHINGGETSQVFLYSKILGGGLVFILYLLVYLRRRFGGFHGFSVIFFPGRRGVFLVGAEYFLEVPICCVRLGVYFFPGAERYLCGHIAPNILILGGSP